MIEIRDLHVQFGAHHALNGVSTRIEQGQWIAPIGPNGAGKSTLLRTIAGLVAHDGEIAIDGRPIATISRRQVAQLVAFVPQRPVIPPMMTVVDYVLLGRTAHISYLGTESRADRMIVGEVLERLSLGPFATRCLGELSGGESQRVVIARALAQQSPIMLLDEPTSSLDLGRQQQVLELIDELRHERALTIVSALHDLTLAGQFADELLLMRDGEVFASGTPADVLSSEVVMTYYGAAVEVIVGPNNTVVVVPRRVGTGTGVKAQT